MRTISTGRGYPTKATYIVWRADQVPYGSYPLNIYSDDVGLCVFALDHTLGSEVRAKEYGRPIRAIVHYCVML